jgi:hypothetical protein
MITFSEAVDVKTDSIWIRRSSDHSLFKGIALPDAGVTGTGTNTITIDPGAAFESQTGYYVQISAEAFDDTAGNSFAGILDDTTWNFTSEDVDVPIVSSLIPSDDSTAVNVNANLVIVFNEPVETVSGNITVRKSSDNSDFEIIGVTSIKVSGRGTDTITINPGGTFASETEYYVQIDATCFDDLSGNSYAGISDATSWNFTTADVINPTVLSLSPAAGATGVGINENLVITFSEAVDVETDSIRIRHASDSSLFEVIELPDIRVTGTSTNTITINPSNTFGSETEYFVQIDSTAFDDPSGNSYAGISDAVSWTFTTTDVIGPVVLTLSPADDTVDVGINDNLKIIFTEPVNAVSGDITIRLASDNSLFEIISVTSVTKVSGSGTDTITINPAGTFASETEYYVQIEATCFADLSGNGYAGISDATSWTFTSADVIAPAVYAFVPVDNGRDVKVNDNLSIIFNEAKHRSSRCQGKRQRHRHHHH